jgi:hypothetical protein
MRREATTVRASCSHSTCSARKAGSAFFDAFRFVSLIGQRPLLVIVGREAVTSWMSIQAFQNATGPKELHWIDGASHRALYYKDQYVGPAVTKLTGFFTKNLAAGRTPAEAASV